MASCKRRGGSDFGDAGYNGPVKTNLCGVINR